MDPIDELLSLKTNDYKEEDFQKFKESYNENMISNFMWMVHAGAALGLGYKFVIEQGDMNIFEVSQLLIVYIMISGIYYFNVKTNLLKHVF